MIRPPQSLKEVAGWTGSLTEFGFHVRDFLHHFQDVPTWESLSEPPPLLVTLFPEGRIADAYLAAVAVELAESLHRPRPAWTQSPERFLHEPWFASPGPHLRATLLLESPPGFRERNLFVTSNALSVR